MAKKYLVFDLDGTLIDSIPDMCREISLFLKDAGRRELSEDEAKEAIGGGAKNMLDNVFKLTGAPLSPEELEQHLQKWLKQYAHAEMALTKPWPRVIETLQKLKNDGYHMAVCTNKPPAPTKAILQKLNLNQYFETVLDADALPVKKPRPEPLIESVRRMGGSVDQSVMIGDSEMDAQAAKAANIPVILLSFGYAHQPMEQIAPDAVIDDFADLPDALEKI